MNTDQFEAIKQGVRATGRFTEDEIQNIQILKEHEDGSADIHIPTTTRGFIQKVLIQEMREVVKISPWIGLVAMSSAIEFLGKCIDLQNPLDWDKSDRSRQDFEMAIAQLNGLKQYQALIRPSDLTKEEKEAGSHFDIYKELRCGMLHAFAPKSKISLSSGSEMKTTIHADGTVNFNATELFEEFKKACEDVISRDYPSPNKVNQHKIGVNGRAYPSTF